MAVASSVPDHILDKDFLENVVLVGEYLKEQFSENIVRSFPISLKVLR